MRNYVAKSRICYLKVSYEKALALVPCLLYLFQRKTVRGACVLIAELLIRLLCDIVFLFSFG